MTNPHTIAPAELQRAMRQTDQELAALHGSDTSRAAQALAHERRLIGLLSGQLAQAIGAHYQAVSDAASARLFEQMTKDVPMLDQEAADAILAMLGQPEVDADHLVDLVIGAELVYARRACHQLGIAPDKAAGARDIHRRIEGTRDLRVLLVDPWDEAHARLYRDTTAALDRALATRQQLATLVQRCRVDGGTRADFTLTTEHAAAPGQCEWIATGHPDPMAHWRCRKYADHTGGHRWPATLPEHAQEIQP